MTVKTKPRVHPYIKPNVYMTGPLPVSLNTARILTSEVLFLSNRVNPYIKRNVYITGPLTASLNAARIQKREGLVTLS